MEPGWVLAEEVCEGAQGGWIVGSEEWHVGGGGLQAELGVRKGGWEGRAGVCLMHFRVCIVSTLNRVDPGPSCPVRHHTTCHHR